MNQSAKKGQTPAAPARKRRAKPEHPAVAAEALRVGLYRKVTGFSELMIRVVNLQDEIWDALTEKVTQEMSAKAIQDVRAWLKPVETLVAHFEAMTQVEQTRARLQKRIAGSDELSKRIAALDDDVRSALRIELTMSDSQEIISKTREQLESIKALVAQYDKDKAKDLQKRREAQQEELARVLEQRRVGLMADLAEHPQRRKILRAFSSTNQAVLNTGKAASNAALSEQLGLLEAQMRRYGKPTSGYDVGDYFDRLAKEAAKAAAADAKEAELATV